MKTPDSLLLRLLLTLLLIGLSQPLLASDGAVANALYHKGDYAAAYREYRALAEVGFAHYQRRIAEMHVAGEGVERDLAKAFAWYALAASQGDLAGRQNMAVLRDQMSSDQLQLSYRLARRYGELYVAPYRPVWQLR